MLWQEGLAGFLAVQTRQPWAAAGRLYHLSTRRRGGPGLEHHVLFCCPHVKINAKIWTRFSKELQERFNAWEGRPQTNTATFKKNQTNKTPKQVTAYIKRAVRTENEIVL